MAIIIRGKTCCALCDEVIYDADDIVATSHFVTDRNDPLWRFSDAAIHITEMDLRERLIPARISPFKSGNIRVHLRSQT